MDRSVRLQAVRRICHSFATVVAGWAVEQEPDHANLLANIRAMGEAMDVGPADVFVSWLPLYHDMGLIGAWLGSLYFAVPVVVMSPLSFLVRPQTWLWAIHRHRATLSAAPNFAFELCMRRVEDSMIAGLDLGSLRMVARDRLGLRLRIVGGAFDADQHRPDPV